MTHELVAAIGALDGAKQQAVVRRFGSASPDGTASLDLESLPDAKLGELHAFVTNSVPAGSLKAPVPTEPPMGQPTAESEVVPTSKQPLGVPAGGERSTRDRLRELKDLQDSGLLTEEEYKAKSADLISQL